MGDIELLTRFKDEVLQSGSESTLPKNLTDFWLTELHRNLEQYFENGEEESQE